MIDILLATFNGDKFIDSQISSILYQTFEDWHLIIHDDGSTDKTVEIIKKWVKKDSRIEYVEDGVICKDAAKNFMHLLKYSNSDYIMFCDQDDIWFDNKVEFLFEEINHMDESKPRVVYSNSYVWKPNNGIIGKGTISFASEIRKLLFFNCGVQGCASMFDAKTRDLLKQYYGVLSMHDHLLNLLAVSICQCHFVDLALMLYRNHEHNVTGSTRTELFTFHNVLGNVHIPIINKMHYLTVQNFYSIYSDKLSKHDKKLIADYLSMPQKSFISKLITIIKNGYVIWDSHVLLILKLCIRPYMR